MCFVDPVEKYWQVQQSMCPVKVSIMEQDHNNYTEKEIGITILVDVEIDFGASRPLPMEDEPAYAAVNR
jgi:hypothetical protein